MALVVVVSHRIIARSCVSLNSYRILGCSVSFMQFAYIIITGLMLTCLCIQGLNVIVFLAGAGLIGMSLYEQEHEELLLTFSRALPGPEDTIDSMLDKPSFFHIRKVRLACLQSLLLQSVKWQTTK